MSVPWGQETALFREVFRYAVFLRCDRKRALEDVRLAVERLAGKPEASERERGGRFLFTHLRRQAPSAPPPPLAAPDSTKPSETVTATLRALSEPDRTVAGLFYLTHLNPADLSRVLGLSVPEVATRLHTLRRNLAPLLGLEPPLGIARDAQQLERAGSTVEGTSADSSLGEAREVVDEKILEFLSALEPTPEELKELTALFQRLEDRSASWRPSPKDPAFLGLTSGVLLLVGVTVWIFLTASDEFAGKKVAQSLLQQSSLANAGDFEPVQAPLAELGDWLALQGIQGFWVPAGFAGQETLAARVFSMEGVRVAAVLLPEHHLVVYLFDGAELGFEGSSHEEWRFLTEGKDVGALSQRGRLCFLVTYRGTVEELQAILDRILPQS